MAHSTGACNLEVHVRIPVGPDIYHRGCAYTMLQTVERHGVYLYPYRRLRVFSTGTIFSAYVKIFDG